MSAEIIHIVGRDTPAWRLAALRRFMGAPHAGVRHTEVSVTGLQPLHAWIGARRGFDCGPVCVWSRTALPRVHASVARPCDGAATPLLVDAESIGAFAPLLRLFKTARRAPTLLCSSESLRQALLTRGVPDRRCVVVPDIISESDLAGDRETVRKRLASADAFLALTLPPLTRAAGAFLAAWTCLLARRVAPHLRLIVPGGGREAARVARLVGSVDREAARDPGHDRPAGTLVFAGAMPEAELFAAADVGLHLADTRGGALFPPPVRGVALAVASGLPVLATPDSPAAFLSDAGASPGAVRVCRSAAPHAAARELLALVESAGRATPRLAPGLAGSAGERWAAVAAAACDNGRFE